MKKWLSLFIRSGSLPEESILFRRCNIIFNVLLLIVIFCLPILWYFEKKALLSFNFINMANWVIWGVFLIELVVMTALSRQKLNYFLRNCLNLFILVVLFPPLTEKTTTYFVLLRCLRLFVLVRLIIPQLYNLHRLLLRNKFGITLLGFLIVTLLSGIIETYIDPSIGSLSNGLWWAWQTITMVGYGNVVPHTEAGRIFAAVLMLLGIGLFSLVSANLAAYFIERGQAQKKKKPERVVLREMKEVNSRLGHLEETHRELLNKLNQIIEDKCPPASDNTPP